MAKWKYQKVTICINNGTFLALLLKVPAMTMLHPLLGTCHSPMCLQEQVFFLFLPLTFTNTSRIFRRAASQSGDS